MLNGSASVTGQFRQQGGTYASTGITIQSGTYALIGGTVAVNGAVYIGRNDGNHGRWQLSGGEMVVGQPGYNWKCEYLGYSGQGDFTQTGGTHTINKFFYAGYNPSGNGNYDLSGGTLVANSAEYLGYHGEGSFTQQGGQHVLSSFLYLGYHAGAVGAYSLEEGDVEMREAYVGYDGEGRIDVNGGRWDVHGASYIAYGSGAAGACALTGGQLGFGTNLYAGYGGSSTVDHSGGSLAVASRLHLAYATGSDSTYRLSGTGDLTAAHEYIGVHGNALFQQAGGANTTDYMQVGSTGRYEYSGGTLAIQRGLIVSGIFDFADSDTVLNILPETYANFSAGAILNGQNASIIAGVDTLLSFPEGFDPYEDLASFSSEGIVHIVGEDVNIGTGQLIYASGDITGDVVNAGELRPGHSPGILTVHGNFEQRHDGVIVIELGGANNSSWDDTQFDQLFVDGAAVLSGNLRIEILNGYTPAWGDEFDIIVSSSRDGVFDEVWLPELGDGLAFECVYEPDSVQLTVVPEPATLGMLTLGGLAMIRRQLVKSTG